MGKFELKGVDLLPTQQCTSRCRHCSYRSSPAAMGQMTAKEAVTYVTEASNFGIEWIWIGGGEPFLCHEMLPDVAAAAKRAGVADVYVVTNGFWATEHEAAAIELGRLSKAGVTVLGVSVDAFHQEYISLDCVKNVLGAAKRSGFRRIEISGQFLASVDSRVHFNQITEKNLQELEREGYLDGVKVSREVLRLCGRAADMLSSYFPTKGEEEFKGAKCDARWLPVESLGRLRAVEIDWQGNVTTCPGICLGNARFRGFARVLAEYEYCDHPIIKQLVDAGPHQLLQEAKAKGYAPIEGGYADACHMCFEARKYLLHLYPSFLGPITVYAEGNHHQG